MVDRIVTALTEMAGPVVPVGHSLAGMVISATAEKAPDRIKTLVFLSAFLPRDGESLLAMEHRNPKAAVQIA
jgi:pimeloyl-ACP methyl ester carboxylesterase